MKVQAFIEDVEGTPIVVTTADAGADGKPVVEIEHAGQTIIVAAEDLRAAIHRARIDERFMFDETF